jgi:hypothetical protein
MFPDDWREEKEIYELASWDLPGLIQSHDQRSRVRATTRAGMCWRQHDKKPPA